MTRIRTDHLFVLKLAAVKNCRSLAGEVEYRLMQSFTPDELKELKRASK